MALLPSNLDYTDRDFDALLARLRQLIRTVFPTWTDEQVANFGNLLVEMFCFVGDVLTVYQDNQARESRIVTARLRRNLLALAKLLAYVPNGRSAATVDETFTLAAAAVATVTLPAGTKIKTPEVTNPIRYQLLADLVFAIGELTKTATIEHSEFQQAIFASSGLANQSFALPVPGYIDGSAEVADAITTDWTEVSTFLDSTSTDAHFVVSVDENERATIRTGDGVNGRIPSGNVTADYKTGGGSAGRVEAGKLSRLDGTFKDAVGNAVTITVTNPARSSGGDDRETEAQIRQNAPASLRVLERSVSREDYEIVAERVDGVARALHLTLNEGLGVGENEGVLFIVPTELGTPSTAVLDEVEAQFVPTGPYPKTNTYRLTVTGATYKTIDVQAVVYLRQGVSGATAKANVQAALEDFFALENDDGTENEAITFGYYYQDADGEPTNEFAWSDLFNVVRDAEGIRKVDEGAAGFLLNGVRSSVTIGLYEFPQLGTLTLINGATGDTL